jgi:hypothetical protein
VPSLALGAARYASGTVAILVEYASNLRVTGLSVENTSEAHAYLEVGKGTASWPVTAPPGHTASRTVPASAQVFLVEGPEGLELPPGVWGYSVVRGGAR